MILLSIIQKHALLSRHTFESEPSNVKAFSHINLYESQMKPFVILEELSDSSWSLAISDFSYINSSLKNFERS